MNLTDEQWEKRLRDVYEAEWAEDRYRERSPGERMVCRFAEYFEPLPGESLLDAGCGTGRAGRLLAEKYGLNVTLVDLVPSAIDVEVAGSLGKDLSFTEACLWRLPSTVGVHDWIYCCDVLEHIPEHLVPACLEGLAKRCKQGAVFRVDWHEARSYADPSVALHLTRRDKGWWIAAVGRWFDVIGDEPADKETGRVIWARPG